MTTLLSRATRRTPSRKRLALGSAFVGLALLAAACSPAKPDTQAQPASVQADATGTVVTTTVSGTSVKFALSGAPANTVNVSINEGATKIGDYAPSAFPKTITAAIGTHTYTLTGWPTPPGGGGTKVFSITTTANVTGSVPAPPPPSTPTVSTSVSGTSVTFALSGVPTNVVNVSVAEGATKIGDYTPAAFPKTITAAAGTHNYALTGWPTAPGGGGTKVFNLTTSATVSGSVPAPPPPTTTPPTNNGGPLGVSGNGRYLTDRSGNPFFMVGDSPQGLIGQLTPAQFATYVANRRAEGFNTIYFDAVAGNYTSGRTDGRAADGTAPFTVGTTVGSYDLSTPNPAYFNILDQFVNTVIANGMVPVVDPLETGLYANSPGTSWMTTMRNNGITKVNNFGRYLGARYANKVAWLYGNDFETWRTVAGDDTLVMYLRDGIEAADPGDLHTIELNYEINGTYTASASRDDANWESRADFDGIYTYNPTYAKFLSEYAKSPAKPTFLLEGQYEGANFGVNATITTPFAVRRQNWWSSTSGTSGIFFSNFNFAYATASSYLASSNATTGTRELGYLTSFLRTFAWQTLVPDTSHTFLTGGMGTYAATGDANNNSYATAAVSADGVGLVYVPTARTITVNFSAFGANPTVQWYNPTTNGYTAVAGPFSGSRSLATPGTHADGSSDWVLVVKKG